MSHGSEDAEDLADVVYQFAGMSSEVVYQTRNNPLTLRDLQNLRASARDVLKEIERAIEVACTCPPVVWQIPADSPRMHMLRCPQHRSTPS